MSITLSALQRQRRDTAANWTAENPTLLAGEIGVESDTGYWKIGNGSTAWASLGYVRGTQLSAYPLVNADIASNAEIAVSKLADGMARQLLQTAANGNDVEWTSNVDVPGTLDVTGAATFDNNVIIQGDLTVNGTETIINTQTLDVEDKNIVIGKVTTPSDVTADGGGITLKGTTDKTISWIDATDAWTLSEHVNIASAKEYRIAGTKVLDATSLGSAVVSSNLTSIGTIGTGTWQGTTIATGYGGTGQTTYSNGQLLIGKTDGTLAKATITQGTGVTITNGDGSITISATGSGGTVTGVTGTAPITSSGGTAPDIALSLKTNGGLVTETGTLAVDLGASSITGTLGVADGGTGQTTYTDGQLLIGNSTGNTLSKSTLTAGTGITITNGSGSISVAGTAASTSTAGVVQLEDSTSSTSTTKAATPNSVKSAYDLANAALPKAGGTLTGDVTLNAQSDLRFADADSSNWVALQGPATVSSNVTWTLPSADGTSGQVLSTNGSGTLSWATASGGGGSSITQGNTTAEVIDTGSDGRFVVTTEGTEALRVDSSRRLLVGTSSSSANAAAVLQGFAGSSTGQGILQLQVGKNTAATAVNENLGSLRFANSDGNIGAWISGEADLQWNSGDYPSRLVFSTTADGASSPTERMRIDNAGTTKFTAAAASTNLVQVVNDNATPTGIAIEANFGNATGTNTNTAYLYSGRSGGAQRFYVYGNGGIANYSANNSNLSDRNSKKDISPAAGTWDCIKEWEIVNYRYKDQPDNADLNLGVIAQQVAESCPEVITVFEQATEDKPEKLGIKEQQMYWMAIKALQEAQVRIEQLEAKVAALESA